MIYCLLTGEHSYTWRNFLDSWGKPLASRVKLLPYERLTLRQRWDSKGVYLFCDLDRLSLLGRGKLAALHRELCEICGSARVLNHPLRSMRRYDLLRTLHAAGLNAFGVRQLRRREVPEKFPVVIRPERGSPQMEQPLLRDAAAYRARVQRIQPQTVARYNLLTVEFCDTQDKEGVYRKYGAFIVGSTIVPRHVFFSRNWSVKQAELTEPRYVEEERVYLDANPHAKALGRIARIADIGYGRIDYALLEGRVQTWEINTNPMIASRISKQIPARRDIHLAFVARLGRAFDALEQR